MSDTTTRLERRLKELRYRHAKAEITAKHASLGRHEGELAFLELTETEQLWQAFLLLYHENQGLAVAWPDHKRAEVDAHFRRIAVPHASERFVWLPLVRSEPVGAELPVEALLQLPLGALASPVDDLRLISRDRADGMCLEFTHLFLGNQYELTTWGVFAATTA
jgi:hypothetical protein